MQITTTLLILASVSNCSITTYSNFSAEILQGRNTVRLFYSAVQSNTPSRNTQQSTGLHLLGWPWNNFHWPPWEGKRINSDYYMALLHHFRTKSQKIVTFWKGQRCFIIIDLAHLNFLLFSENVRWKEVNMCIS